MNDAALLEEDLSAVMNQLSNLARTIGLYHVATLGCVPQEFCATHGPPTERPTVMKQYLEDRIRGLEWSRKVRFGVAGSGARSSTAKEGARTWPPIASGPCLAACVHSTWLCANLGHAYSSWRPTYRGGLKKSQGPVHSKVGTHSPSRIP